MNGIVPPIPINPGGRPNHSREARSSDPSSHGANGGAFKPAEPQSPVKLTLAPYGGSVSSNCLNAWVAVFGLTFGGIRSDKDACEVVREEPGLLSL